MSVMEMIEQTPRLLTAKELEAMPFGHGWLEWEPEAGGEPDVQRVGWADDMFAIKGCYLYRKAVMTDYNSPNGLRIWVGAFPPGKAESQRRAWNGI